VGAGTFLPVKSENLSEHKMHSEWGEVTQEIANKINEAKQNNRRVICIGTTSLRIVESIWAKFGKMQAFKGDTDLFITPGYSFQVARYVANKFSFAKIYLINACKCFCRV
jgi:S-adenosylmethionine:tRNA ribosyltransferase-isomerase